MELLGKYAALLKTSGAPGHRVNAAPLLRFKNASLRHQQAAIQSLRWSVAIESRLQSNGLDPSDAKNFVTQSLEALDANVDPRFIDLIEKDYIIEYYDRQLMQFLRNLRFFEVTSFSIDQLYFRNWKELTIRSPLMVALMMKVVTAQLLAPRLREWKEPQHRLWEVGTEGRCVVLISLKHITPVYQGDREVGFLTMNRSTLISSQLPEHAETLRRQSS